MKLTYKYLIQLSIGLCCITVMAAEAYGRQGYLIGAVLDSSSHKPIAQASVQLIHKPGATISNDEGGFMLHASEVETDDSLKISCVGYESKTFPVRLMTSTHSFSFFLKPVVFALDEVNVRPLSAVAILENAIRVTLAEVPSHKSLLSYYKEFAYLDGKLYKYSDAAVDYEVIKGDDKSKVKMNIIGSRIKKDSTSKDGDWRSQVESLIKPDKAVEKYYSPGYLNTLISKKNLEHYTYRIETFGDLIKISADPKSTVKRPLPNAVVYITANTNRIIKVNYGYLTHLQHIPKVNLLILAGSYEKFLATMVYREEGEAVLRYCKLQQDMRFKVGKKKGLLGSVSEVLVQEETPGARALYSTNGKSYKKDNIYQNGTVFSDEFWLKYNTTLPTEQEMELLK